MILIIAVGSIQRWVMAQPYKAALSELCEDMAGLSCDGNQDIRNQDYARDENDVEAILDTIKSMTNPFDNEPTLLCISSQVVITSDVAGDISSAYEQGKIQYKTFIKERVIEKATDLFSTIPRQKDFSSKQLPLMPLHQIVHCSLGYWWQVRADP